MKIVNMRTLNQEQRTQAAQILTDELHIGWPTLTDAENEIKVLLFDEEDDLFLAAMDNDEVIGWCGIFPHYDGKTFEIRPVVVKREHQRKGVGTALINEISKAAKAFGGLTIWAGADDEMPGGETSFANVDLFDNLPKRMQEFDPGTHPSAFFMKIGFVLIGAMPHANGIGKPDIYFAKPL